jgi:hypothetical protein
MPITDMACDVWCARHAQAPFLRWDALQQQHAAVNVKLDALFKLLHSSR